MLVIVPNCLDCQLYVCMQACMAANVHASVILVGSFHFRF